MRSWLVDLLKAFFEASLDLADTVALIPPRIYATVAVAILFVVIFVNVGPQL